MFLWSRMCTALVLEWPPGASSHTLAGCWFELLNISSGVARAFPVGRVAHPEGQNEDEN